MLTPTNLKITVASHRTYLASYTKVASRKYVMQ